MKKNGHKVYTNATSIELRPKVVDQRIRIGKCECDLIFGKQADKTAINAELERVGRYIILSKLPYKDCYLHSQEYRTRTLYL